MVIQDKSLTPWKMGDPISASRLNDGENRKPKIAVTPPLSMKQVGNVTYLGMDRIFLPRVARIAERSSDFAVGEVEASDVYNRYYVRPCNFTNSDSSYSDALTFEDYGATPSDFEEAVENFGEPSNSHLLKIGQPVVMYRRQDDSPVYRYFIDQPPPLCVSSDWTTQADLTSLNKYISDATFAIPSRTNTSDFSDVVYLQSDASLVIVRGHMFQDTASDVNPWFAAKMPFVFPVKLQIEDSDLTGDSDTNCAFTYTITSINGVECGSDLTPTRKRFPKTQYAWGTGYGLGFYTEGGAITLWDANELPASSDCG